MQYINQTFLTILNELLTISVLHQTVNGISSKRLKKSAHTNYKATSTYFFISQRCAFSVWFHITFTGCWFDTLFTPLEVISVLV